MFFYCTCFDSLRLFLGNTETIKGRLNIRIALKLSYLGMFRSVFKRLIRIILGWMDKKVWSVAYQRLVSSCFGCKWNDTKKNKIKYSYIHTIHNYFKKWCKSYDYFTSENEKKQHFLARRLVDFARFKFHFWNVCELWNLIQVILNVSY